MVVQLLATFLGRRKMDASIVNALLLTLSTLQRVATFTGVAIHIFQGTHSVVTTHLAMAVSIQRWHRAYGPINEVTARTSIPPKALTWSDRAVLGLSIHFEDAILKNDVYQASPYDVSADCADLIYEEHSRNLMVNLKKFAIHADHDVLEGVGTFNWIIHALPNPFPQSRSAIGQKPQLSPIVRLLYQSVTHKSDGNLYADPVAFADRILNNVSANGATSLQWHCDVAGSPRSMANICSSPYNPYHITKALADCRTSMHHINSHWRAASTSKKWTELGSFCAVPMQCKHL